MYVPRFQALVDEVGKLHLNAPDSFHEYVRSRFCGKLVNVTVSLPRKGRSDNQNRYYWGVVLKTLCDETGEGDVDDMHAAMAARFLRQDRELSVLGESVRAVRSTTSLSTVEMEEYLEKIRVLAAEYGIVIPEPNQIDLLT